MKKTVFFLSITAFIAMSVTPCMAESYDSGNGNEVHCGSNNQQTGEYVPYPSSGSDNQGSSSIRDSFNGAVDSVKQFGKKLGSDILSDDDKGNVSK